MKKYEKLEQLIKKLNAPVVYEVDGEKFTENSLFRFVIKDGKLYDENEVYNIDYAYESFCLACDAAAEFGFEKPKQVVDKIAEQIAEALGNKYHAEWIDSVVMGIYEN